MEFVHYVLRMWESVSDCQSAAASLRDCKKCAVTHESRTTHMNIVTVEADAFDQVYVNLPKLTKTTLRIMMNCYTGKSSHFGAVMGKKLTEKLLPFS